MKQKKTGSALGKILMGVGLVAILAAAGLFGYNRWISMEAGKQSDQAVMALLFSDILFCKLTAGKKHCNDQNTNQNSFSHSAPSQLTCVCPKWQMPFSMG